MAESKTSKPKEEEVGGFNPERRKKRVHEQVGPTPTDDPHHEAAKEIERKVIEQVTRLPPG